jgi:hypothetical protein
MILVGHAGYKYIPHNCILKLRNYKTYSAFVPVFIILKPLFFNFDHRV